MAITSGDTDAVFHAVDLFRKRGGSNNSLAELPKVSTPPAKDSSGSRNRAGVVPAGLDRYRTFDTLDSPQFAYIGG